MKKLFKRIMGLGVIAGLLLETFPVWALTKDETIYAKLDNNGQVNKVIISEHLQGTGEKETFDRSRLNDIKNINGDEKFTKDGNKLIWESNGKDIYYQGQTKEELPISLKITYYFNGVESTIKDMLGKKGTVRMVLKYTNNDKHETKINDKYTVLYTPFVVATTTILPNDINYNIKVKNGKVVANGTNSIVVLLSTPGLYESLGIDKLKGMDTAEIIFDTDSFELNSIYSVSTPKLIDKSDLDIFNNIDGIYNSINTLVDSSQKLKSGSNQLLSGAEKLKDGVNKLKDGINSAYNGSKYITDTVAESIDNLNNDNTPATLSEEEINTIKATAKAGVDAVFFGENPQTTDINIFAKVAAKQKVDTEVFGEEPATTDINVYAQAAATQKVNAEFDASTVETLALNNLAQDTEYSTMKEQITNFENDDDFMNAVQTCTATSTEEKCVNNRENIATYKSLKTLVGAIEKTAKSAAVSSARLAAIDATKKAIIETYNKSLTTAEKTIIDTYNNLVLTAQTTAVRTAETVANLAKNKAKEETVTSLTTLLNGLNQLTNGLNTINNSMVDLDTGTSTLKDGIATLDNGIYQFNSQGINKISNLVNGDIKTLEQKIKVLGQLSINYGTFDDSETGTEGATKIIMVVDEIKEKQANINSVDKNTENTESLWDKIKDNLNKKLKNK